MLNKVTPLRAFIISITIVSGLIGVPIIYYSIGQIRQEDRFKNSLNSMNFSSLYREVYSRCVDVELRLECSKGYYVEGDISKIESDTIADLNQKGYGFEKIPGGSDGPSPAYRSSGDDGRTFIIKFVDSNSQVYKKDFGNVQIRVF